MSEDLLPAATDGLTDRFARAIAVATVVVTLLGAVVGYSAARIAQAGNRDATSAAERAVAARGIADRDTGLAQLQYERYRLAEEQRTRASNAEQRILAATEPGRRRDLRDEHRRWLDIAAATEATSARLGRQLGSPPVPSRGAAAPNTDLSFPSRFFAAASEGATRKIAEADALNERSTARGSKLSIYAVVLATLAVAVYLFSFALTPYGRAHRGLFAATGGVLAAAAAATAGVIALGSVHTAPPAAAAAYARGEAAYVAGDYQQAIASLSEAIRLRPTFAGAFADRAAARVASLPENLNGGASLAPPGALRADVADERKAIALKVNDPSIETNLGYELYSLASTDRERVLLDESVDVSRRAMRRDPHAAEPAFNLGLALLLDGRWRAARAAYVEGIRRTLPQSDADQITLVSAALTDLSNIAPRVDRGQVAALKSLVVGSISRGKLGTAPTKARVSGLKIEAVPSTTLFHVLGDKQFDPSNSDVWAQWYAQSPSGWSGIDAVSGWLQWCAAGQASGCLALNNEDVPFEFDPYLAYSEPSRCLRSGRYRLELYANGKLLATTEKSITMPRLVAAVDRITRVALCQPASWRPVAGRRPGLLSGWESRDHRKSAYVAHVTAGATGTTSAERLRSGRRVALGLIADRLPGRDLRLWARGTGAFMHLEYETHMTYRYRGGLCDVGWGYEPDDDSVIVGAVCGPDAWSGTNNQLAIANSFARI